MNTKGKLLILILIVIGIRQTSQASITYVDSPKGNWAYSTYSKYSGGINYYPTTMSEFESASFVDYVTYGAEFRGQFRINPSASTGFHVFSTWITSDHDQSIFFINGGDDGHSVFVDGVFLGGGGFGVNVTGNIALKAGVARQLTVVTHNSGGEMHANFHTNPTQNQVIEDVSGITISAISPLQTWRSTYFGSPDNAGDGADLYDFDNDGIPNIMEFAFGLHPKQDSSGMLPQPQRSGDNFITTFTQPPTVSGITYGAEWSTTLLPDSWTSISNSSTPPLHTYSVPMASKTMLFMRLKVSSP